MAEKTTQPTTTTPSDLTTEVLGLLQEFQVAARTLNPKKATKRGISRSIATLKSVIADIEMELSK
jgi:hypothetical protein